MDESEPSIELEDLLSLLTLEEKCSFLSFNSPGVERLGITPYNAWNEGLHGVSRAGIATVFPQLIGMAASFDSELLFCCASAIGDEFRSKQHEALRRLSWQLPSPDGTFLLFQVGQDQFQRLRQVYLF
jgi:beta-glucosidase